MGPLSQSAEPSQRGAQVGSPLTQRLKATSFSQPCVGPACLGEARGELFPSQGRRNKLFQEKIPGHYIVSLFGCWHPCGLIFDQIHTNEEPNAPGAEGDISGGQA